jgi:hypothetical protein
MRNEQTLKTAIYALLDQIKLITVPVTTAPGTSGVPANAAAFETLKTAFDELLN